MFNNVSIFGPEPCLVLGRGAVLGALTASGKSRNNLGHFQIAEL